MTGARRQRLCVGVVGFSVGAFLTLSCSEKAALSVETAELRARAGAGDAEAQWAVGMDYSLGVKLGGAPQDHGEAARWFLLAAEQGHAKAQYALGFMHVEGLGLAQDNVLAYMWSHLAASRMTGEDRENAVRMRDVVVGRRMAVDEITEAKRLAQEWDAAQLPER